LSPDTTCGSAPPRHPAYRLDVGGLGRDEDLARFALVFGRPYGVALPIHIGGIVLFAAILIGSVVLTALTLAGKLPAAG
jgi:hypothetical protein